MGATSGLPVLAGSVSQQLRGAEARLRSGNGEAAVPCGEACSSRSTIVRAVHDKVATMNFFLHLRQEWDVIVKSPFACVLCLVFGFAAGSWYYAEQVATLTSQVAFWKDKATAGATPTPGQTPAASAANTSAHFILNAEGASFYASPDNPKLLTGIVLDVQIRNSGISSKATGWSLTVT